MSSTPTSFHLFPNLPTELRLEIWRAYFAICHGTQVHIFLSTSEGPRYIRQDAATGAEGYNTLAGARVCADAWSVFQESFYVGDMRWCLRRTASPPSPLMSTTSSTITTSTATPSATTTTTTTISALAPARTPDKQQEQQEDLRFAISRQDMMYIIDTKVSPILLALSSTPWFRRAPRVAVQVFNFHTPEPNPELLPDPRPYPHNLDYWGRNWVLWNRLLSSLFVAPSRGSPLLRGARGGIGDGVGNGNETTNGNAHVNGTASTNGNGNSSSTPISRSTGTSTSGKGTPSPRDLRALMTNPALEQLLFVVVPNRKIQQQTQYQRRPTNRYGFQVVDPESFALGSADEVHAVNGHAGLTYSRVHRAFPGLGVDRKIGYVADAVPGRAGFSCLEEMFVNNY